MQVLDDLGDRSEPEVRQEYFSQIDKDGSGAIDFEEFLGVSGNDFCVKTRTTVPYDFVALRESLICQSL